MTRGPVAVTCGDPAGIGPEIAVAAWSALKNDVPMIWLGDPTHLPPGTPSRILTTSENRSPDPSHFCVLPIPFDAPAHPGAPTLSNATGIIRAIETAAALALQGDVSAICTAPINKKVLKDGAAFAFPGHTEFLAHLGGGVDVVMMLASEELRVVPVTIHIALSEVPSHLTPARVRRAVEITADGLRRDFGIDTPRLAVAGLNPHAGEGGAMGHEEVTWLNDLVTDLAEGGLDIRGPLSADTLFHAAARAQYDAAICMYHDQALIPIKTLDFDRGVNVTLGLPFIRTSPDHGTAYDIAGKGVANPTSMIEAIRMADRMARAR